MEENEKVEEIVPSVYFENLKQKRQEITDYILSIIYDNCITLFKKYERTGQIDAMKKLIYHLETLEKERQAVASGVTTFVYSSDIQKYIETVKDRTVKIIELERFEREIPDEIIEKYEKVKNIFTNFYIVFSDYTGEHVDKTKKDRDPILFGAFKNKDNKITSERLYFIGDWEDEYCDLTLDKLIREMRSKSTTNSPSEVLFEVHDTTNLDELRGKLKALEEEKNKGKMSSSSSLIYYNSSSTLLTPNYTLAVSEAPTPVSSIPQEPLIPNDLEANIEEKKEISKRSFFKDLYKKVFKKI